MPICPNRIVVSMHELRVYLNIITGTTLLMFARRNLNCLPISLLDQGPFKLDEGKRDVESGPS